jgi:hypothetical protein
VKRGLPKTAGYGIADGASQAAGGAGDSAAGVGGVGASPVAWVGSVLVSFISRSSLPLYFTRTW